MTAPSNANTSGLVNVGHIVWWKAGGVSYYPEGEAFGVSKSCRVEPLVTAASAQARIAELDEQLAQAAMMIIGATTRAAAAEARTDRLAKALEPFSSLAPDEANDVAGVNMNDRISKWLTVAQLVDARAALQQETQP